MRAALLTLSLVLTSGARADSLRTLAEKNAKAESQAMMAKNIPWFQSNLASDYTQTDLGKKPMDRAKTISEMRMLFESARFPKVTAKVIDVRPTHGGMVVTTDVEMVIIVEPKGAPEPFPIKQSSRYVESWSKDSGKWRLRSQRTTKSKITVIPHKPGESGAAGGTRI